MQRSGHRACIVALFGKAVGRSGKAEAVAQRAGLVFGPEKAAALQFRHHFFGKGVPVFRQQREHQVEAVRGSGNEPVFQLVGDLDRRSGDCRD